MPLASPLGASFADGAGESAVVDAWVTVTAFNGVVLTGRGGRARYVRAFGQAVVETAKPALPSTRYAIGSVSKWLTTAAVMRLVDGSKLDLDAPVTAYLPSFRVDTGHRVMLRHLLSNTSGVPDHLSEAAKDDPALRKSTASAAQMVTRFGGGDLASTPGAHFDYTVLNWVIVRAMLEATTGESFPKLINRLVSRPLGLTDTGIAEAGFAGMPGLAAAYRSLRPPVVKMDAAPAFAAASGTFYSNAADMLRAAHGIFGARFLSPRARRELLTVRVPEEEYALGGRVHVIGGRTWAWETGKIAGYRAHVAHEVAAHEMAAHEVAADRTIVVLGNTDMQQATIAALVEQLATQAA